MVTTDLGFHTKKKTLQICCGPPRPFTAVHAECGPRSRTLRPRTGPRNTFATQYLITKKCTFKTVYQKDKDGDEKRMVYTCVGL